jgi:LuxR family transcriptional regulator, maltose regulon positive regulatory protein
VLVIAPPGFGKTTLLAQWQRFDNRPFAWMSLDTDDNDPVVLWTYVRLAIRSLIPGRKPVGSPDRSRVDLASVVPQLLTELEAVDSEVVLVLEDFHWITNPVCLASLGRFLDQRPPNLSVVLSARSDPQVPLGELRVRGDLLELNAADLSFTVGESEQFLNETLRLGLKHTAIRSLWDRTEGWPAGLYLAYLSLRNAPDREALVEEFRGTSSHIVEYLTDVVLDAQEARMRDFLLGTSILERMSGPLCDFVLETEGSAQRLEALERANLFIVALDDHREWYRYHRLFVELLRDELRRRQPERIHTLHQRAARWLREAGHIGEAIRHALEAEDLETAKLLASENYLKTLEWGGLVTIENWLKAFPRHEVVADARLSIVEAWVMSFQGRHDEADLAMENALRSRYQGPLPDGASSLEASAVLLRASGPRGDVGEMLKAARRAFELEGDSASMWNVTAHVQLGWALLLSGERAEAKSLLERAAMLAPMTEQWLNAFGARCLLAWAELEEDRVADAERWALDALQIAEAHGLVEMANAEWGYATLGAVRARQGRIDEAEHLLARSIDRMRATVPPILLAKALLALAPVKRSRGSPVEARAALDEARTIVEACSDCGTVREHLERVMKTLTPGYRRVSGEGSVTERELEVLRLLEKGMSKREIARTLYLSYNTIHSHTKSIHRKLGAFSRAEAIQRARESGIL